MFGVTSAGALTLGSGAFTSTTADRGVSANVVSDDEALVGYKIRADKGADDSESSYPEIVVTAGESEERTSLVTVVDRFGGASTIKIVDVEVTTQGDGEPTVIDLEWDEELKPTADIRGRIACSEAKSDVVEITVTIEGIDNTGVTATLFGDTNTRRFIARCEPKPEPDSNDTDQSSDGDAGTGNKSGM